MRLNTSKVIRALGFEGTRIAGVGVGTMTEDEEET